jgi:hypothetical protein
MSRIIVAVFVFLLTLPAISTAQTLPDISAWKNVLSFRPSHETQQRVIDMGGNWSVHRIEAAKGQVNLDIYSVQIKKLPTVDGVATTPATLLRQIRLNLNSFLDTDVATFRPFNDTHKQLWESSDPTGSIVLIDMKLWKISPDSGCVVTTQTSPNEWIFSTIRSGHALNALLGDEAAAHPVSGNRAFGLYKDGDNYVFYCVAADRPTLWLDNQIADQVVFPKADQLWRSLQRKVVDFVNANGGEATVKTTSAKRFEWDLVRQSPYYATEGQPTWK